MSLILNKLKFYLTGLRNLWKIVLTIILSSTAAFYGFLLGELSNKTATGEIDLISTERISNLVFLAILILTIVRMLFPSYSSMKQIFPEYYPLSKLQIYLASIVDDLLKPYFLYLSIFILIGSYCLENSALDFLYNGLLVLFGAQLLRRCIQYQLDYRLKVLGTLLFVFLVGGILYLGFLKSNFYYFSSLELLIVTGALLLIGFIQESAIIEKRNNEISSNSNNSNVVIKLLFNNKKARVPLIVGFLFKLFVLLFDLFLFKTKGEHLFEGQLVFWLLASPIIIFTYVFNNTWGFWKSIWLNMELRIGDYKPMIKQHFRLMLVPLLVDLVVTIPILLISWKDSKLILLFYFTTACYLIMLSFLWSLITPRKINTTFQMKGSSSPLSVIAAMGGVLLLTTIKINHWFYFLIPLYLVIGVIAYWLSTYIYKDKKYIITNKIMKE
jgi:hypothetical protein